MDNETLARLAPLAVVAGVLDMVEYEVMLLLYPRVGGLTYNEVAALLDKSFEYVNAIESGALDKLRAFVERGGRA